MKSGISRQWWCGPDSARRSDVVTVRLDEPVAGVRVLDSSGVEVLHRHQDDGWSIVGGPPTSGRWVAQLLAGRRSGFCVGARSTGWRSATRRCGCGSTRPAAGRWCRCSTPGGRSSLAAQVERPGVGGVRRVPGAPRGGGGTLAPAAGSRAGGVLVGLPAAVRPAIARWASGWWCPARSGTCCAQTLTLWDGADRLGLRIAIDDFTGADKLLRLRWPCPVPKPSPVNKGR